MHERVFLQGVPARANYVDHNALVGPEVDQAFPSARDDIREVGNCLAADSNTAAVFHMMRAVEWALRALASDLGLWRLPQRRRSGRTKWTPVEYSQWEHIITQLHTKVDVKLEKLRPGPKKQNLQQFYYPALQDFQGFVMPGATTSCTAATSTVRRMPMRSSTT